MVVLTGGTDWPGRAAREQRSTGVDFQLPQGDAAKIKALRRTINVLRKAVKAKHDTAARYLFRKARALVNALPAHKTKQECEQLAALRQKFRAQGKPPATSVKKPKPAARSRTKTSTARPTRRGKPAPAKDLGDRFINRASLGYGPSDKA
ncbi:hypothetical protein ACFUVV_05270 [Streptomyces sp. NPDC057376]|uniref:hypothetical protein n=1 Tax=Streptomyces sp. NPDC057376 TaxID=3346110 RepID=UPI00362AB385